MDIVQKGDTVRLRYRFEFPDGEVIDKGLLPITITIGEGAAIVIVEEILLGMKVEEEKLIRSDWENRYAYGKYKQDYVITVPRSHFPHDMEIKKGDIVKMLNPDENTVEMAVTNMGPDGIVLDGNHPLAGKPVMIYVKVLSIKKYGSH